MQWSDLSFTDKTTRQFAALWMIFFSAAAAWLIFARGNVLAGAIVGGIALTLGPLGLWQPRLLRPIFIGWMAVVFPIGWVISHVLLAILFYGLFTPIAIFFRIIGRDALQRRFAPDLDSYWQERETEVNSSRYFRQF